MLVLAVVAGAAAVALLVASLAWAEGTPVGLVAGATAALVVCLGAVGSWALAARRGEGDPLVERAETASKLAHELKNPLMAIKGLASTGSRMFDKLDDTERREFFTLIDGEAARLTRVVEQASTALKVDADQLVYLLNEEDLGPLVEKVAWASPHGDHPMSIETDPGIVVRADRRYLTEVIGNIVDNASKFSPPDAPIDVSVRRRGGRSAVIEISDRGPGIPPERTEQVFERFGSWRPAGYEETPGAGLGLFLARAHVLAHSGRVDVAEREDGGTILRITLPAEAEE
jgi:two-component system, OmpR family, sensor histidine kinase KdpD